MTFDPDKYLAEKSSQQSGGFNPDKYLSEKMAVKDNSNPLRAGMEGAADAATFGWLNNIRGATEPLVFGALNAVTGNDVESDPYIQARDSYEKGTESLRTNNPKSFMAGQLAGGLTQAAMLSPLTAMNGLSAADKIQKAARIGAAMGAAQNTGNVEGEISYDPKQAVHNTFMGAGLGAGLQAVGEAIPSAMNYMGNKMKNGAEDLAVNATGATGAQAEKFADNAGRELLDRGQIKFGDSAKNISDRVRGSLDDVNAGLDNSLKTLDSKGAVVKTADIVDDLTNKINALKKDPSQADVVRKMQTIIDDIQATGVEGVPLSEAEKIKRGFNRISGNWQDPEKGMAGKNAYLTYKNAVENSAEALDPEIAKQFVEQKKSFQLLNPIEEAASRRANTLNQSPFGGLLDTAAGAYGLSDPDSFTGKAALAIAGRRLIAPRLASSAAVTMDKLSKVLISNSPKFARLAETNPKAFTMLVNDLANKQEFKENPRPFSPKIIDDNNGGNLLELLGQDPSKIDTIQNDNLKEQLKKQLEQKKIKERIPIEEAQNAFVKNN